MSPFTFFSFKKTEWFFEFEVCPLHEVKMDRILKNKSVVNFISDCLLFSTVGPRIADNVNSIHSAAAANTGQIKSTQFLER